MSIIVNFFGQNILEPGAYSRITSGQTNPPLDLGFGNVLIIDKNTTFGGGSGVNGEQASGENTIYQFNDLNTFREFVTGGEYWAMAEQLFFPNGPGFNGVSTLYYVRALTTVSAKVSLVFTGGGANGGTFAVEALNEGVVGNGIEDSNDELKQGYSITMEAGVLDPNKFVLKFWKGTFTGEDSNGIPWNGLQEENTKPRIIATSDEFDNVQELLDWAEQSFDFNSYFKLGSSSTVEGDGSVDAADLANLAGNNLFAGGTSTYVQQDLLDALGFVAELEYESVLAPDFGASAQSADNGLIFAHITTDAKYDKVMVVGGGDDRSEFATISLPTASFYNNEKVCVVHGAFETPSPTGTGTVLRNAKFKAALVLGRVSGLEPQVPGTFKPLRITKEVHTLTENERNQALLGGLIFTKFDIEANAFIITQSINTLQGFRNRQFINPDGSSYEWSVVRIKGQLNKELAFNAKTQLLLNEAGPNRNTLSDEDVRQFTISYLQGKVAEPLDDNLIIQFQDVVVTTQGDSKFVTYRAEPNFPVNKLFFTGFIFDPNI